MDVSTGEATNLGLVGFADWDGHIDDRWLVFNVPMTPDLSVVHYHDLSTGETTDLGFYEDGCDSLGEWRVLEAWLAFVVLEGRQGKDLNQDGDLSDFVPHVYDLESHQSKNLGLSRRLSAGAPAISGQWLVFRVSELGEGDDLNGDDEVNDTVVHVHDLESGETTNLGLTAAAVRAPVGK